MFESSTTVLLFCGSYCNNYEPKMKHLLTPLILVLLFYQTNAQDKLFRLNGTVNVDTGTVMLL